MSDPVSSEAASVPHAADAAGSSEELSGVDPPRGRARRRLLAIVGLVLVVAVVVVIATDPFGGSGKPTGGVVDNASAVSLASVKRQSLSQQTQVSGTLGYAGSSSIRVPSGTAPTAVQQSSQQVTSAETMLAGATGDAGLRHAGARGSSGDARGGAREGAGRLRGRGRRGSGIRGLLARKRKRLAE